NIFRTRRPSLLFRLVANTIILSLSITLFHHSVPSLCSSTNGLINICSSTFICRALISSIFFNLSALFETSSRSWLSSISFIHLTVSVPRICR
ncbi:unnamed protein product, partial [Amoebophrya sp. A25]